ncbi:hypothetical protein VTL71DRAFT_10453 [Oculimacula yallundae]|uniref:Uncharacterized protein n=1 Tax=Oculimacula yallundae TaxID=86028 RepID=A0ABR4CVN3_9HELO
MIFLGSHLRCASVSDNIVQPFSLPHHVTIAITSRYSTHTQGIPSSPYHQKFSLESHIEPIYEANEGPFFLGCLTKAINPSTRSTSSLERIMLIRWIADTEERPSIAKDEPGRYHNNYNKYTYAHSS